MLLTEPPKNKEQRFYLFWHWRSLPISMYAPF